MDNVSGEAFQHSLKAYEYIRRRNYQAAHRELQATLKLAPTYDWAHQTLASVAGKLKLRMEIAEECRYELRKYGHFETIDGHLDFVLSPDISIPSPEFTIVFSLLIHLSMTEFKMGIKRKAQALIRQSLVDFNRILSYDPDYVWIRTKRAWCYIELNEWGVAEALFQEDINRYPDLLAPYTTLAVLRYHQGNLLDVVRLVMKGLRIGIKHHELNVLSQTSRYEFASEAEKRQYYAKDLD